MSKIAEAKYFYLPTNAGSRYYVGSCVDGLNLFIFLSVNGNWLEGMGFYREEVHFKTRRHAIQVLKKVMKAKRIPKVPTSLTHFGNGFEWFERVR